MGSPLPTDRASAGAGGAIPVAQTMRRCILSLGGCSLDDLPLPGNGEVADYFVEGRKVILELKSLEEDTLSSKWFKEQIQKLHSSWVYRGLVPPLRRAAQINTGDLPEPCQEEVAQVMRNRIQKRIKKANSQIKNTKQRVAMPDAKGVLLLAADGDGTFSPGKIEYYLHHCTAGGAFSSINTIIYFGVNQTVTIRGMSGCLFWREMVLVDEAGVNRPAASREFLNELAAAWFRSIREMGGPDLPVIKDLSRDASGDVWEFD